MNDASHTPKNVNISSEISTDDHVEEDVVIKVKTGVASENHEGIGHVKAFMPRYNLNQGQMMKGVEMELKQNMFEIHSPPQISIKDIFSFTSDRELMGNDEEKIAEEDIIGNHHHRTRGDTDTAIDDDYEPPYMMDNIIMDDPIDEFDYFQNDRYQHEIGDEPDIIKGVNTADIDYAIDDE